MKTKRDLPVGQKVRGYGLLNEYGEFDFIPEQTGIRKGKTKVVKQTQTFTLSETANCLLLHVNLEKQKGMELLSTWLNVSNEILMELKDYDF